MITNLVYHRGEKVRMAFGFIYPTDFAAHVVYMIAAWVLIRQVRCSWIEIGMMIISVIFFEKYCDVKMGARPLKRAIQTVIEDPLAEEILQGRIRQGDHILATIQKEKVVFKQRQNAKELDL